MVGDESIGRMMKIATRRRMMNRRRKMTRRRRWVDRPMAPPVHVC
jgi:hypothetical protein